MKCLVNWIPLRVRVHSRNTQPHFKLHYMYPALAGLSHSVTQKRGGSCNLCSWMHEHPRTSKGARKPLAWYLRLRERVHGECGIFARGRIVRKRRQRVRQQRHETTLLPRHRQLCGKDQRQPVVSRRSDGKTYNIQCVTYLKNVLRVVLDGMWERGWNYMDTSNLIFIIDESICVTIEEWGLSTVVSTEHLSID